MNKMMVFLFVLLLTSPQAHATEIGLSDKNRMRALIINKLLHEHAYQTTRVDETIARKILINYLNNLDPYHQVFLQSDLDLYNRTFSSDALSYENVELAFNIYNDFKDKSRARFAALLKLMKKTHNFTVNENYDFPEKQIWPAGDEDLANQWRKQVKHDVIELQLREFDSFSIDRILRHRYKNMMDEVENKNEDDIFALYVNSYIRTLDNNAEYLPPNESSISVNSSEALVGITIGKVGNEVVVKNVLGWSVQGGALNRGDAIIAIGELGKTIQDIEGMPLQAVASLLRGNPGSKVELKIKSQGIGPVHSVVLIRNAIDLQTQRPIVNILTVEEGESKLRIGTIKIANFYADFAARARGEQGYKSCARDVKEILKKMNFAGVDGIVIDLRGNGGEALMESIALADLFIDSGPVVQVKKSNGDIDIKNMDRIPGKVYAGPLAILINGSSAGVSELFASAIKIYQRGIVIGEPSFGIGHVQIIADLNMFQRKNNNDLGKLKFTMAEFYSINGNSFRHNGVQPDFFFPGFANRIRSKNGLLAEKQNQATINPLTYTVDDSISQVLLNKIKADFEKNILSNATYGLVKDEYVFVEKALEVTNISLNLNERKKGNEKWLLERKKMKIRLLKSIGTFLNNEIEPEKMDFFELADLFFLEESARVLSQYIKLTKAKKHWNITGGQVTAR